MAAENHLLSKLDASALALLKPHMRTISVEHGELLHSSASEIEFAYFPRSCIVSVLATTEQGATAETSIVGREGMIGSSTIHGITTSFADSIVQVAGEAVKIPAAEVHRVGRASESFRKTRCTVRSFLAGAVAAIDRLPGAAPGGKPGCALAPAVPETAGQQRYPPDPGILRANARSSAHHDQSGRAHPAECRSHSDRPRSHFHRRRQGTAGRLMRLLRSASSGGTRSCWARSTKFFLLAERIRQGRV